MKLNGINTKIKIVGNPIGTSGYAIHTRNLTKAMIKEGIDIQLDLINFNSDWSKLIGDNNLRAAIEKNHPDTVPVILIMTPENWEFYSGYPGKKYGFLVFEGSKLPFTWIKILEKWEGDIFVPSWHVLNALIDSLPNKNKWKNKVWIIPHGVDKEIFKPEGEKMFEKSKFVPFRFLFVGGWSQGIKDRKSLDIAIKAFLKAFPLNQNNTHSVEFIIKINKAYCPKEKVINDLADMGIIGDNRIKITDDELTEKELAKLYRSCDCFVMPSKAEAYGIPLAEAVACGIPVITSNYGGQTDYINKTNGILVGGKMIKAESEPKFYYHNAEWLEVDVDKLANAMKKMFKKPIKITANKIKKINTWDKSAKYLKLIIFDKK